MAEPTLEEGEIREPDSNEKKGKSKSNPLQSLLSKKVKIFGREIPMPLIILAALGIGIVLFTLIGKKGGSRNTENQETTEDTSSLGFSEGSGSLGEYAQSSAGASQGELLSDLGGSLPIEPVTPSPFEPVQTPSLDISPLPMPELPYTGSLADSLFAPPPYGDMYPSQVPYEQSPIVQLPQNTSTGSNQSQQQTVQRLATNKVTANASQSSSKPNVPTKNTSPTTSKPAAKATAKPISNAQPTRLPTPPPKPNIPAPKPPAKATPKPVINPQPVKLPTPPTKPVLPRPIVPVVPPKTTPKTVTGNKGTKNR